MRRGKPLTWGAIVVAGLLATGPAMSATTNDVTDKLPPESTQGSVTFMTGGIGQDEAAAMRKEQAQFPLTLEFIKRAQPTDEYLAGVKVTIKDREGNDALQAVADGPFMLARLPDGKYTVIADNDGRIKSHDVVIAAHKRERVVFAW